jgi:hypothetical protein
MPERGAMTRLTEKQFMAQVVALARLRGWRVYHTFDSRRSAAGFPDLVLCRGRDRRLIFAELKLDGTEPTPAQAAWLGELARLVEAWPGLLVACWRPRDWAEIEEELA